MAVDRSLLTGEALPASWLDAIQEYISTGQFNFHLSLANSTTVRVKAGTYSAQVGLGIDGMFRYISTTVNSAVTGPAGAYDVFAVTGPNSFAETPDPDTDDTDYSFDLQVLASGDTPSLTSTVTNFRKVGEIDWDGSHITGLRPLLGDVNATDPLTPTSPTSRTQAIRAIGASGQSNPIQTWEDNAGDVLALVDQAGKFVLGSGSTVPTVTPATDSSTKIASTGFVQSAVAAKVPAAPTVWTPTFTTPSEGDVVIGSGSVLTGRYYQVGPRVFINVILQVGSGFNGKAGSWSMSLPPGLPAALYLPEQELSAKLFVIAIGQDYLGFAFATAGNTTAAIFMPQDSDTTTLAPFRIASSDGASSTGVPQTFGSFPLTSGGNLVIWGSYMID